MTDTPDPDTRQRIIGEARRRLGPLARRLGVSPDLLERGPGQRAIIAAQMEQVHRAQERLEAYADRVREERAAHDADLDEVLAAVRSLLRELSPDRGPDSAGAALAARLDHGLLHAEAQAKDVRDQFGRELADLRSTVRLTQALVDRAFRIPDASGSGPSSAPARPTAAPDFEHPTPSFELLYRSFEDHHRGSLDEILERQRTDYLELLAGLPNPDLPVADLGCGRGELVNLLDAEGHPAVGVDANLGQVADADQGDFHQDDLFRWLDGRDDASCRAVVALHVIEHLPAELQVRLVFEARRVLAPGGMVVLETPNTLSLNIGASNFWVDPTHERPVHPMFLEFLATEAGFTDVGTRYLHPIPASFPETDDTAALVADLNSLILGSGDLALVATR